MPVSPNRFTLKNPKVRRWRQLGYSLDDIARRIGQGERLLMERNSAIESRDSLNEQIRGLEREIGELWVSWQSSKVNAVHWPSGSSP